ncbi:MAG: polysaccharide deacetylase family protein [Pirellulales bacterium]|nr:polysaccharide deacetylase family protein [Pirellulales bacterium]
MLPVVKRAASVAAGLVASSRLLDVMERMDSRRPNLLRVLTYHRVDLPGARPELRPNVLSATPRAFEEQMRHLAGRCHVVSLSEVLAACRGATALPPRSVLITFDDAYRDFAEHAWPILRKYGLPAVLFVPTGFPDRPDRSFWWDRLHQAFWATDRRDAVNTPLGRMPLTTPWRRRRAARRINDYIKTLPHRDGMDLVERLCRELDAPPSQGHVLGWEELRRLAREGLALGAHTRNHSIMHRVSTDEARAEAAGSLEDLKREVGPVDPVFAYPAGGVDDEVVRILGEEGFRVAFTTAAGINDLDRADPLRLCRLNVSRQTTLPLLRARLLRDARRHAGSAAPV